MFMNTRASAIPVVTISIAPARTAPSMETGRKRNKGRVCAGFTLVEMILVMAIMVILLSVIMPSMKGFFRGRNLDNEARRFLSLTRYGQSRAVSEGIPVELWINPRQGSYGLQALSGYSET